MLNYLRLNILILDVYSIVLVDFLLQCVLPSSAAEMVLIKLELGKGIEGIFNVFLLRFHQSLGKILNGLGDRLLLKNFKYVFEYDQNW